jgi:hypothetical protein
MNGMWYFEYHVGLLIFDYTRYEKLEESRISFRLKLFNFNTVTILISTPNLG